MSRTKATMTVEEAFLDIEARFLYTLPPAALCVPERLFFQLEQAHWFYEDFIADHYKNLPHFGLKAFAERIFEVCPLFVDAKKDVEQLHTAFNQYRSRIPTFGCILLNPQMTKFALVRNWSGKSWGFPKGKLNQDESHIDCAVRETYEETGFDASNHVRNGSEISIVDNSKLMKLFIATNVPEDTYFEPQCRKEISKIEFFPLNSLPKKHFNIFPFMVKLRTWISVNKRIPQPGSTTYARLMGKGQQAEASSPVSDVKAKAKAKDAPKEKVDKALGALMAKNSKTRVTFDLEAVEERVLKPFFDDDEDEDRFDDEKDKSDALCKKKGWSAEDMFKSHEQKTGKQFTANIRNPNTFTTHPQYTDFGAHISDQSIGNLSFSGLFLFDRTKIALAVE